MYRFLANIVVVFLLVTGRTLGEEAFSLPLAIFNGAQYVTSNGRTQEVRVLMLLSHTVKNVELLVRLPKERNGITGWEDRIPFHADFNPATAMRAQRWAAESKAKRLEVADKPLEPKDDKQRECRLRFFAEDKGQSWGVTIREWDLADSTAGVRLRDKQADEYCQILQDLSTPIKRQRVIERGKRIFADAEQKDTPKHLNTTGDQLKY